MIEASVLNWIYSGIGPNVILSQVWMDVEISNYDRKQTSHLHVLTMILRKKVLRSNIFCGISGGDGARGSSRSCSCPRSEAYIIRTMYELSCRNSLAKNVLINGVPVRTCVGKVDPLQIYTCTYIERSTVLLKAHSFFIW